MLSDRQQLLQLLLDQCLAVLAAMTESILLGESLRDRLAIFGQIVIAERAGFVGVIEVYELPIRRLCGVGIVKHHRISPHRKKVLVEALLQAGGKLLEWHTKIDRRFVDAGDTY